jgi:hypothetical protein
MKNILGVMICLLCLALVACPPKPPQPKVWLKVCNAFPDLPPAEARLANEYCPSTHLAQYLDVEGQKPSVICSLHKKPEEIPVCQFPWPDIHFLLAVNYTYYSGLVLTEDWLPNEKLKTLYNDMVKTCNAVREFAFISCPEWDGHYLLPFERQADGKWDLTKPNKAYYAQLLARLKLAAERKLTTIIALVDNCSFYAGSTWEINPFNGKLNVNGTTDQAARFYDDPATMALTFQYMETMVARTQEFAGWIIWETANEGGNFIWHKQAIEKLKAAGVPVERIQVEYWDSGEFWTLISDPGILNQKGLAGVHCVCSEHSVDWWKGGAMHDYLMPAGAYPVADGPDFYLEAQGRKGINWPDEAKRPSPSQMKYITQTMKQLGGRGVEFLSAAPMVNQPTPNLDDALNVGRDEREAMFAGYAAAPMALAPAAVKVAPGFKVPKAPAESAWKSVAKFRKK